MGDSPNWLSVDEESLWRSWLLVNAKQHAAIACDLKTSGLSEPEFEILVHLTDSPHGGLRISELAQGLQWERSRISHQITRMVNRGLIERQAVLEDARGARVLIADAGRVAIEKAAPGHVATVRDIFIDRLDEGERMALSALLRKLQ